jgi:DNA-binding transcriptional MocR family regulator
MAFVDQIGALRENEAGPRYMRLQKLIRHAVDSRRLSAGSALPSERDLCEEYGLSALRSARRSTAWWKKVCSNAARVRARSFRKHQQGR